MDMESFSQCMQYLQSTTTSKSSIELFIPLISAATGVILGFGLNYLTSTLKENKSNANKLNCCREDLEQTEESLKKLVRELYKLASGIVEGKAPTIHQLPNKIGSLCLPEYFTEVAHKFSKKQRLRIQSLLQGMEALNDLLTEASAPPKGPMSYRHSTVLVNSVHTALECWSFCRCIETDKELPDDNISSYIKEMGVTNKQYEDINLLIENSRKHNSILNLA